MKKEDIMRRAIGEIDDDLIEDADTDEDSPVPLGKRKSVILKRAAVAALAAAASALLIFGGLSVGRPRTPDHPEATSQTDLPATESSSEPDTEDIIITIVDSQNAPDLDLAVSISDAIVKGEVIEAYESGHSNPTDDAVNALGETIPLGIVTKYYFRVDEVYYGSLNPGDVISLETAYDTGLRASVYEKHNVILDGTPFSLAAGQSGIFLLAKDEVWTSPASGDFYGVVHGAWGVLEGPDGDGSYSSPVYKVTPDSLVSLIDEVK